MKDVSGKLLSGSISGILATGAMTAVMFGGKWLGLLRTPPPKHITDRVAEAVGIQRPQASKETFTLAWLAAHVGYGAASGCVYSLGRPLLPIPAVFRGLIYGGALWAFSYLGIMPALGFYPFPGEDSRSRRRVMIAAHAVYGITLAETEERALRLREPASGSPAMRGER